MYQINEKYTILGLIPPQSVASKANVSGTYVDLQGRKSLLAVVHMGAVAAGKSVKVEVLTADDGTGAGAKSTCERTFTAPTGGVSGHVEEIPITVRHDFGRYLTVKVTNEGTAAALASAELIADSNSYPEERPGDPAPAASE